MGLAGPCFIIRHALSILAALRHLPALLDAVAAVGAVGLHAGLDDVVLGRAGGSAAEDLFDSLAASARFAAIGAGGAFQLARGVDLVLLRKRSRAEKKECEG